MKLLYVCLTAGLLSGQTAFDVASIKLTPPDSTGQMFNFPAGVLKTKGTTARFLIAQAYEVMEFQVVGGPAWLGTERYDIIATSEDKAADAWRRAPAKLQALLAERFALKVRNDSKELTVLALVPVKGGAKMHEAADTSKPGGQTISQPNMLKGIGVPIGMLIKALSIQLKQVVLDRTGLTGRYDFQLDWLPDGGADADLSSPGSVFVALQEKLGLKLQAEKAPVPVVVVEQVERPSAN